MPEIVVINGPPGVGKTTVATALSALQPGTVHICGDELRSFAPPDARRRLGSGSTYRAGAVLADAYTGMGASRVLFDYVFLRPLHIAYFWNALGENVSAHLFTLWAPLEVVEERERMRAGRAPLGVAVADCHREIEANRQVLGHFLQTGDALPEVVAGEIHRLVAKGIAAVKRENVVAIGLKRGAVQLISYQQSWKILFEKESTRLRRAMENHALAIEHVGSTSIEGMDAKPVIDIMVAVESLDLARELAPIIEELGYEYRNVSPERLFFANGPADERTHYLSLTELGSAFWRDQLLFRDYLRTHTETAEEYKRLKRELAEMYPEDRGSYTAGKTNFVETVLKEASENCLLWRA
jgi:GrpB-like predicted nucleotidyltransferase (UPF0157 family)/predicted kinase